MTDPDRYAKAVYEAALNLQKDPDKPHEPWESLPEWWRATFRREAAAVQQAVADQIIAAAALADSCASDMLFSDSEDHHRQGYAKGLQRAARIARGEL